MDNLDLSKLSAKELYSEEVICSIMDEEDPVTREQLHFDLLDRAAEFGERIEKRVEQMWKVADKDRKSKEKDRKKAEVKSTFENYTDFGGEYPDLKCGIWKADKNGIYNPGAYGDTMACPHPILPIEIISNVEDGTQKLKLAWKRGPFWQEKIFRKSTVANKNKITELAERGIMVSSETAKNLAKYLFDVEMLNEGDIPLTKATVKMGWCEGGFMPYFSELIFDDSEDRFSALYSSISSKGDYGKWLEFVKDIRSKGRIEPRAMMAASFASVLMEPCGLLPFWFDLCGDTGGGKSICGMLAASVWADSEIGRYISDADSTTAAFEVKSDFLNHLPLIIDDTVKLRDKFKDDFSQMIYQITSGEGKDRSNSSLGLAHKATWRNITISSGETPLITDGMKGGAINRVLEFNMETGDIFEDGPGAATFLRNNYGFAGKEFARCIFDLGNARLVSMQRDIYNQIQSDKYESKQLLSLSALILADKLATDLIFKDGIYLSFEELEKVLTSKNALSENERCYDYVINECMVNDSKFIHNYGEEHIGEIWGRHLTDQFRNEYVAVLKNPFNRICASGGFNAKAFLVWAGKNNLLWKSGDGTPSKTVSLGKDYKPRCYVIKLPQEVLELADSMQFDDEEF